MAFTLKGLSFCLLSSSGGLLLFFSPFKSTASCFLSVSWSPSQRHPAGASRPSADPGPASSEGWRSPPAGCSPRKPRHQEPASESPSGRDPPEGSARTPAGESGGLGGRGQNQADRIYKISLCSFVDRVRVRVQVWEANIWARTWNLRPPTNQTSATCFRIFTVTMLNSASLSLTKLG